MSRIVEAALSNRSACKKCKEKIAKDELRVGVKTTRDEAVMISWYHPACAPKKKGGAEPSEFEGYEELSPEHKEVIDKLCAGELEPPSAKKQKVSADAPPTDDMNSAHPAFAETYGKYAAMSIPQLKEWLVANDQPRTGSKPQLVAQCVDGELHGALPPCPLCEHGKLKFAEPKAGQPAVPGQLVCGGHFSEESNAWRQCGYKTDVHKAKRVPWRHATEGPRPKAAEAAPAVSLDVSKFEGLDAATAAELLATVAKQAGATMSDDAKTARIAAGTALNASRNEEGALDPAKAFAELLKKYPPKKTAIATAHPANAKIADLLKEYADLLEKLNENPHGINGTRKAVSALMQLDFEITSGKALLKKDAKVEGVGASTASKIDEILEKGTFDKLEEMRARASAL